MILADGDSDSASIWQLVESCAYVADLDQWSQLAQGSSSVLDLGCGIGRVSRHLAAQGLDVLGVDQDRNMVDDLNRLAQEPRVAAIAGDVTDLGSLDLGRRQFETIIAPQQLLHILGGMDTRLALFAGLKQRLQAGGVAAFAISELVPQPSQTLDILPDLREIDDWVYASRPVAVESGDQTLTIVRLREVLSPEGLMETSDDHINFDLIDRHSLAAELLLEGLAVEATVEIPETERHIASVIVVARHVVDGS